MFSSFVVWQKDSVAKYIQRSPPTLSVSCCRRSFLSHRRNAGWRVRGARGQSPRHRLPERLLLYINVHPVPLPVRTTCWAQGHLWRPPHLLSLCDIRPALHIASLDYWVERKPRLRFPPRLRLGLTLIWILLPSIPPQIDKNIWISLGDEVVHYNFRSSFFDIFVSVSMHVCVHITGLQFTILALLLILVCV